MTRLALAFSIVILLVAGAGSANERDVALAPDGTLFTIEAAEASELGIEVSSSTVLKLTIDLEDISRHTYVPETLMGGRHQDPALLFDTDSNTLFVFWVRHASPSSGELLVAAFRNDAWTRAMPIDSGVFRFQQNLGVAVTRLARTAENASERRVGIHLVWWEENGYGQLAKYALLQLEEGNLQTIAVGDLRDFAEGRSLEPAPAPDPSARAILQHPSVTETAGQDGVEIVFGDWDTNRLQRVELVPVAEHGVLKPPIGVWRGEIPVPEVAFASASHVSTVLDPTGRNRLVLWTRGENRIHYLHFDGSAWSAVRTVGLERVSEEGAVMALRKLLVAQ